MKISYNWLREFVDFPQNAQELGAILDQLGHGVDTITEIGARWSKVVVGKVAVCERVPNSVHLTRCEVDVGGEELVHVICGAPNVAAGQIVPLALEGAVMPDGFTIAKRRMKGLDSHGMICSEKELALSEDSSGILILPSDLPLGDPVEWHIGKRDWIFDLEITFNRPDCLSHLGVAREIAAFLEYPLNLPSINVFEDAVPAEDWVSVEILSPERCPRYTARVMKGVTVKPSPLWMQERLRSVGLRPINNIVDVTNYVLMELGHPLHAFDFHLVTNGRIIVRLAEDGERFITLDNKDHTLTASDLLIADPTRGVALAGVMGGLNSEIKDDTTDVLLECAYFEPTGIRATSRDRGIVSESSRRFERGVDPEATPFAVSRAARLIQQLGGGKALKGMVDNYALPWQPLPVGLRPRRVNNILATRLDPPRMGHYLEALGCEVLGEDDMIVTPPSWRSHDLQREIDLIEEIARMHGYDKIHSAISSSVPLSGNAERERRRRLIDRIKQALVELGMNEAINLSLISTADAEIFPTEAEWLRVLNPLSDDLAMLRVSLCPGLLRAVARNLNSGNRNIRLFEWGACFWKLDGKIIEEPRLGGVLCGDRLPETWIDGARDIGYYDLKGLLEQLACKISLDNARFISYHIPGYLQIGGAIMVGDQLGDSPLGWFGRIDPILAERLGVDVPVWYFEMNGRRMLKSAGRTPQYQSLTRFPAALRDLAFVMAGSVTAGTIVETIQRVGGEYLESVEIFDLFKGGNIPADHKSLAFHLIFRSPDRTLSDREVDETIEEIIAAVTESAGATLRTL